MESRYSQREPADPSQYGLWSAPFWSESVEGPVALGGHQPNAADVDVCVHEAEMNVGGVGILERRHQSC